jgi:hypothetical protein
VNAAIAVVIALGSGSFVGHVEHGALVVAQAGGVPVTAEDLARHGAQAGDVKSIGVALRAARLEVAVAGEAETLLGDRVVGASRAQSARALLTHLHGPASCSRIPERLLDEHYRSTRWRFIAPPAWRVEDLQLLCCENPRDCLRPEVAECVARRASEAARVRTRLSDHEVGSSDLAAEVARLRAEGAQAARSEYIFYYDPQAPDAPVDGRLQTVDDPIARAVGAGSPTAWIGPIATRFGHHILRVLSRRAAISLSREDPRTDALLRTELCPPFLVEQRERYGSELARNQAWKPFPENLTRAFDLSPP